MSRAVNSDAKRMDALGFGFQQGMPGNSGHFQADLNKIN